MKIKVDGKNMNPCTPTGHHNLQEEDLFVYGHRLESIVDYFAMYPDVKMTAGYNPNLYGVVGTYERARWGSTKEYDALDLGDLGWVKGAASIASVDPKGKLLDLAADTLLYTERYFVVITSYAKHLPPKDQKFVSGQKSSKVFLEAGNQVTFQEIHDWLVFNTADDFDWEKINHPFSGDKPKPLVKPPTR